MLAGTRKALPTVVEECCAARTLVFRSRRMVEDAFRDTKFFVNKESQVQSEGYVHMVAIASRACMKNVVAKMDRNGLVVSIGQSVASTDIATCTLRKGARPTT